MSGCSSFISVKRTWISLWISLKSSEVSGSSLFGILELYMQFRAPESFWFLSVFHSCRWFCLLKHSHKAPMCQEPGAQHSWWDTCSLALQQRTGQGRALGRKHEPEAVSCGLLSPNDAPQLSSTPNAAPLFAGLAMTAVLYCNSP